MTHTIVIICRAPDFVSTQPISSLMQISFPNFIFFTVKSLSVTQILVSQENAFKRSKNPSAFLGKTIGSNNSFTLVKRNFRFLR